MQVEPQSWVAQATGKTSLDANSSHKQSVKQVGRGLRIIGTARTELDDAAFRDAVRHEANMSGILLILGLTGTEIFDLALAISILMAAYATLLRRSGHQVLRARDRPRDLNLNPRLTVVLLWPDVIKGPDAAEWSAADAAGRVT